MKTMNSYINIAILIFGLVSISMSCSEFLDEPKPTTAVTPHDVFSSEDGVRAHFNGIYRNLRSQWRSVDGKSGGYTDTWGFVGINLTRMVKGTDMMVPYGWYAWDYRHENRNSTYYKVRFIWDFLYENINQANIIIKGVEESDFPDSAKNKFIAEARALRAWSYFNLIREYQHPYSSDPNAPGIPIYTEPASIESVGESRGTVQAVYDQIVNDLDYAVQNFDPSGERLLKSNINISVAYGLLARVKLDMRSQERCKRCSDSSKNRIFAGYGSIWGWIQ